jgi:stage V sporulation protein G
MSNVELDVRAYPVNNEQSNTKAFASVSFKVDGADLVAIHGIRVVDGAKGLFVTMPQSKDKDGEYHDIAFPLNGDLRKELNKAVLNEYGKAVNVDRKQSIGDKIADGKAQAAQQQRDAAPVAAYAKKAPGLGD